MYTPVPACNKCTDCFLCPKQSFTPAHHEINYKIILLFIMAITCFLMDLLVNVEKDTARRNKVAYAASALLLCNSSFLFYSESPWLVKVHCFVAILSYNTIALTALMYTINLEAAAETSRLPKIVRAAFPPVCYSIAIMSCTCQVVYVLYLQLLDSRTKSTHCLEDCGKLFGISSSALTLLALLHTGWSRKESLIIDLMNLISMQENLLNRLNFSGVNNPARDFSADLTFIIVLIIQMNLEPWLPGALIQVCRTVRRIY